MVGRKNHYGSKSRRGTEVASRFYTILETCKLHDVNPAAYVHAAVLAADRGEVLLPWHFEALQSGPSRLPMAQPDPHDGLRRGVTYVHAAVLAADRGEVLLPWHFVALQSGPSRLPWLSPPPHDG